MFVMHSITIDVIIDLLRTPTAYVLLVCYSLSHSPLFSLPDLVKLCTSTNTAKRFQELYPSLLDPDHGARMDIAISDRIRTNQTAFHFAKQLYQDSKLIW